MSHINFEKFIECTAFCLCLILVVLLIPCFYVDIYGLWYLTWASFKRPGAFGIIFRLLILSMDAIFILGLVSILLRHGENILACLRKEKEDEGNRKI